MNLAASFCEAVARLDKADRKLRLQQTFRGLGVRDSTGITGLIDLLLALISISPGDLVFIRSDYEELVRAFRSAVDSVFELVTDELTAGEVNCKMSAAFADGYNACRLTSSHSLVMDEWFDNLGPVPLLMKAIPLAPMAPTVTKCKVTLNAIAAISALVEQLLAKLRSECGSSSEVLGDLSTEEQDALFTTSVRWHIGSICPNSKVRPRSLALYSYIKSESYV